MTTNLKICDCGDCETAVERAIAFINRAMADGDCPFMVATVGHTIGNLTASALLTYVGRARKIKNPAELAELADDIMGQLGERGLVVQQYLSDQPDHRDLMRCVEITKRHWEEHQKDAAAIKGDKPVI